MLIYSFQPDNGEGDHNGVHRIRAWFPERQKGRERIVIHADRQLKRIVGIRFDRERVVRLKSDEGTLFKWELYAIDRNCAASGIHQYEKGLIFTDGRGDVADGMLLQAQIFVLSGKDRMDRAATDGLGFYCVWHGNAPSLTRRV